jgi:hypothetical protein
MGFFILLLATWNILINDIEAGYQEMLIVFFLGLIFRICCVYFRKYAIVPIEKKDNVKWIAKRKFSFFLVSFLVSGIVYFVIYQLLWNCIFNCQDINPYKQILVAIFFGIFLSIYLMEYLWREITFE